MKKTRSHILNCVMLGASALALAVLPARATLKYQPGDYVQNGLVVHLDGIANVGADAPHDPGATVWANLADANNPAKIFANSSSGWRNGSGYYFCYASGTSYAQLVSAAPAMTQATFEFVFEGSTDAQIKANNWGPRFISAQNDMNIHVAGKGATQLNFKSNNWTGNVNDGAYRAQIPGWSWKQASFTFGEAGAQGLKSYDQGVLKQTASRATAEEGSIPATRWVIAMKKDSDTSDATQQNQLVGTMKSIRIYNRALTADEVAANAAIDAARFDGVMPVTNAVVATSVAGAEGNERSGAYAVNGSHVFTAPPSATVSGTTYALTGCTVERWENGAWSSPAQGDGVFAVAVSESEKVRITWQWTAASGTLNSYVSNGLVVWLDGIWNSGVGIHSASARSWANLANNANNAWINTNSTSSWEADGYHFTCAAGAGSYAKLVSAAPAMTRATFEFAFDGALADQNGFDWGSYFISMGANNGICGLDTSGTLCLNATGWTGGSGNDYRPRISNWGWKQASFSLGEVGAGGLMAYEGGMQKDSRTRASIVEIPATQWCVANYGTGQKYQAVGTMKGVRIYNRALSPTEVAQNAAADAARFDSATATAVEVVADPRGLVGREPAGLYFPQGWTFSAGTATQTVGSVSYAPAGYMLETWDATLSSWVLSDRVLRNGGNAVEWTSTAAPYATTRLTWLWEPVSGVRAASDYTIGDYVQGGLAVWFDGICNDGIGEAHQTDADFRWRELVSGQQANISANDNSGWEADGYHFAVGSNNEKSYVYLRKLVSLGGVGTIEISCNTKASDQTASWAKYLTFGYTSEQWGASYENGMGIMVNNKQTFLRFTDDRWAGQGESDYTGTEWANWNFRANTTSPWDGKHAAFVVDTDNHRSYKLGVRDAVKPRKTLQSMPAAFWMMGNTYYNGTVANDQLVGTMKAVRAYNRVLTDAEIAQNYKVDVARFDGALVSTNVVVADSEYNGSLAADAYEVYGTHVFEGANSTIDGSAPNRVKVWTLQNGTWVLSETIDGAAYTYTLGTSPATVKIEFGKTNPFVMIIR